MIFITAYPERFLTGQRPEPAFLIAKPFQVAVVSAVVSQALFFGRKARQRERQASRVKIKAFMVEMQSMAGPVPAIDVFDFEIEENWPGRRAFVRSRKK